LLARRQNHFIETNPRHNLPVLLALVDVWNDTLLGASGRVVTPFSEAIAGFPTFVATLESQTCSRPLPRGTGQSSMRKTSCSSLVIDGGLNGSYDRSLYQSEAMINSELVAVMDSQVAFNTSRTLGSPSMDDIHATQDAVLCSLFAHCDELAFGSEKAENGLVTPSPSSGFVRPFDGETSEGNRPSTLLMCGKLDAFTCGQLVALAEHRAVVKAHIWGVDPFVREVGSSLRTYRSGLLKDELQLLLTRNSDERYDDGVAAGPLCLSTKTILEHYATQMRNTRIHTSK
jgi:glucose-6-phosphate isomerase